MKYLKLLGFIVAIALALIACTGSASATIVTSPSGTQYSGTIKAELAEGEAVFSSSIFGEARCKKAIIEWKVESQGAGVTAKGSVSTFDYQECSCPVTTLKNGSVENHTDGLIGGNATMTGSGQEFTSECLGIHCVWATSNTDLGVVKGGFPARIQADGTYVKTGGRSGAFCGSSITAAASYKIVTPSSLLVD